MAPGRAALLTIAGGIVAGATIVAFLVPRWFRSPSDAPPPAAAATSAAAERKITATLYYISEDGMSLVGSQREVPYGEGPLEQARRILEVQLSAPPAPLVSAVPSGTALKGLYLTDRGDAFVDLSTDARTKHPGGALDELFTVYTIVNALSVNLPAVQRVQILVDGKEVDTLAGHVDLRHPLQKNLQWVKSDKDES